MKDGEITFSLSRSGQPICTAHSVPLHSAYNPIREAQKFVSTLDAPFTPRYVVVTGPALSYTVQFLRQRFTGAMLFAVRYCASFRETDALWDGVFYVNDTAKNTIDADTAGYAIDTTPLKIALYNKLGEEGLFSTFFCAWPPSSRAFPVSDAAAWRAIQEALSLSRDVLATRTKFASRWVLNAFTLCVRMQKTAGVERGSSPIVIAASGNSLAGALPRLKERRSEFFLIALSSALPPLDNAGIKCDLCLTTDGGFYAKSHLTPYMRTVTAPLAIAAEGCCPQAVLERCTIVPLVYPDGPGSEVLCRCAPQAVMMAERNGTVSGTALRLARQLTTGRIYFCGLDLSSGKGRQHCPPNALDVAASAEDTRLRTAEGRATSSRLSSSPLMIYRQWFSTLEQDAASTVYRLSDGYCYNNTLGHIRDVGFEEFNKYLDKCLGTILPKIVPRPLPTSEERRRIALDFIGEKSRSKEWLHEIFIASCIACERIEGNSPKEKAERERREDVLHKKNKVLIDKIYRILHSPPSQYIETANMAGCNI